MFKIPDSDKIGLHAIKGFIRNKLLVPNWKLESIKCMIEQDTELTKEEREVMIIALKKEYERRKISYE